MNAILWGVAALLGVLFWPIGLIVAGLLAVVTALVARSIPRPFRIVLFVVGIVIFLGSSIAVLDFTWGVVQLRQS